MHHRSRLKFGIIDRSDIGPDIVEIVWPNGDRSYGKGRFYVVKAWLSRVRRLKRLI